jgi:hypothetical protein
MMMTHQQEPLNGPERRKGTKLRWDPTIGAGAILQAITVVIVIGGGFMAYSAFTTATTIKLENINTKVDNNQTALLEKFAEAKEEDNKRDVAGAKALADMKAELSTQQQQTAANVAQLQRTIDQTLPRVEDRITALVGQISDIYARLKITEDDQDKLDRRTFELEQFKTKVESASPGAARRTGG